MKRLVPAFLMVGILGITALAQTEQKRIVPPIRGEAQIEIIGPETKSTKDEVVSKFRIRNASTGSIALLTLTETWYDKTGNALGGDSFKYRKPFLPGEVIEAELHTPRNPKFFSNQFQFTHANGNIKVTKVKSFPGDKPAEKPAPKKD